MTYVSPTTGELLANDTPHSLQGAGPNDRWPVVDGIPFLRVGRSALVAEVLTALDDGNRIAALGLLLADADPWWDEPPPARSALEQLARDADHLTLREAMEALGYGRVGTYFAHRWSDPTYVAGLALLEGWSAPGGTAFELGCGIGHFLAALETRGTAALGGDIVFSKLWLARHWVVPPSTELVCFDAAAPWPFERQFDLVFCNDAFYFFEPKEQIARAMVRHSTGTVLIGHVHNTGVAVHSAGAAVEPAQMLELLPGASLFDDADLTRAGAFDEKLSERSPFELSQADAISVAYRSSGTGSVGGCLGFDSRRPLTRNPLYRAGRINWPTERYREEYALLATYPAQSNAPAFAPLDAQTSAAARRREFVQLPERW